MSKHLICYGSSIINDQLYEITATPYYLKRIQFWKWRSHQTMGRPILIKRGVRLTV